MKTLYKISFLAVLFFISSCSKTDLKREQYGVIYLDQFYQNDQDAEAALTGLYHNFYNWDLAGSNGMRSIGAAGEAMSDGLETLWAYTVFTELEYTKNENDITRQYNWIVQGVSKATNVIANLEKCPMQNLKLKKQYIAEAKALRTQLVFYGYDFYGGVGLVVDPEKLKDVNSDYYPKRWTKAETAKFIADEINAIAVDLPDRYEKGSINYGRVTKGMVYMILMKIYMQEHEYNKAETVARLLMTQGYSLVTSSYADIFSIENEQNNETIWSIGMVADHEYGFGHNFMVDMIPGDYPTKNPNQQAWNGWRINWPYYRMFEPGDDRLNSLVGKYISKSNTLVDSTSDQLKKGAIPIKYGEDMSSSGVYTGIDLIVYRYADVLLSLAECINENNGGPNQEAVDLINQVRSRSKASLKKLTDFSSKESFNNFLLDERGRELWCEGFRHMDLTRMEKYVEMVKLHKGIDMAAFRMLAPIPQEIIDQSKGIVVQNPGY